MKEEEVNIWHDIL